MPERILTTRDLNRAVLARQLLLERANLPLTRAIEQVGSLQTQYAPSGYVGLWTRLAGFERASLTRALEEREVIQATLLRTTIHMISRGEFWRYAMGVREPRRVWARRNPSTPSESELIAEAEEMRAALADGPRTVKELGEIGAGFVGDLGPVGGPRAGATVRDVGAASRGSARPRGVLGRSSGRHGGGRPDASRSGVPAGVRAGAVARYRPVGRHHRDGREAGRGGPGARHLPGRGRSAAGGPARPAAPRPGHAGTGPLPAALGRAPACPRTPDRRVAGGLSPADLHLEEPVLGRDRARRRSGGRGVVRSRRGGWSSTHTSRSRDRDAAAVEDERAALEAFQR